MSTRKLLLYYNDLIFKPSSIFLEKDFGQVPLVLSQLYNYDLEYVISTKEINLELNEFKNKSVKQFKKQFLNLSSKLDFIKNFKLYYYLFKNRGQYSALVFFPFVPFSDYIFLKLFKFFNKQTIVYLKLDANIDMIKNIDFSYRINNKYPFRYFKTHYYYRKLLTNSDLISYETIEVGNYLRNNFLGYKDLTNKIVNIFNGISEKLVLDYNIKQLEYNEKENIVLIIGRHGAIEKNTELVFKATQNLSADWKFIFLGPIENKFQEVIKIYREKILDFDKKYIFKGLVSDKKKYFEYLNRSKILLLTSNKEGFPMVFPEALYFNNYIITTDVSGSVEATNNSQLGKIFRRNDFLELEKILKNIFDNPTHLKDLVKSIKNYSDQYFVWEKSLGSNEFQKKFRHI